jgi:TetR/AcrR family transcriptional repressor of uid operon
VSTLVSIGTRRRPGRPTAITGDVTRSQIIRSARRVFAELGYQATTFTAIADRAELTRPCISYHFATKRMLYRMVGVHVVSEVIAVSIAEARRQSGLIAKISGFIASLEQADIELPGSLAFLVTSLIDGQRDESLRDEFSWSIDDLRQFLDEVISDAVQDGELPAVAGRAELVEMLLALVCGVLLQADGRRTLATHICRLLTGDLWVVNVRPVEAGARE